MSENRARGPVMGHGHRGRGMHAGEKAKNFKGAMETSVPVYGAVQIPFCIDVPVCRCRYHVSTLWGPKILGKATTELFTGLVAKVNGTGGIDFEKIAIHSFVDIGILYLASACFLLYSGLCDDRNFQ